MAKKGDIVWYAKYTNGIASFTSHRIIRETKTQLILKDNVRLQKKSSFFLDGNTHYKVIGNPNMEFTAHKDPKQAKRALDYTLFDEIEKKSIRLYDMAIDRNPTEFDYLINELRKINKKIRLLRDRDISSYHDLKKFLIGTKYDIREYNFEFTDDSLIWEFEIFNKEFNAVAILICRYNSSEKEKYEINDIPYRYTSTFLEKIRMILKIKEPIKKMMSR